MNYQDGEALVLAQLKLVTGFSAKNVDRVNWLLLNSGNSDHYGIVKPGTFQEDPANNMSWVNHTVVEVWQMYRDDGSSQTLLEGYVAAVKDRFVKYRKLGDTTGTIMDSRVTGGSEMQEMWKRGGGLAWVRQDVTIEWRDQEVVTYAE